VTIQSIDIVFELSIQHTSLLSTSSIIHHLKSRVLYEPNRKPNRKTTENNTATAHHSTKMIHQQISSPPSRMVVAVVFLLLPVESSLAFSLAPTSGSACRCNNNVQLHRYRPSFAVFQRQQQYLPPTALFSTSTTEHQNQDSAVQEHNHDTGTAADDDVDDDDQNIDETVPVDRKALLAEIDALPVGSLVVEQIIFLREMMTTTMVLTPTRSSSNKRDDDNNDNNKMEDTETVAAVLVERLLYRLLDEWQAAMDGLSDDSKAEEVEEENLERMALLEPTLDDFRLVMTTWEQEALKGNKRDRRKKSNGMQQRQPQPVDRVSKLFGILNDLWEGGGVDTLKPNSEIVEIVLRVLASSRERGLDRRAYSIFERVRDDQHYGFVPTCDMYQSVIASLGQGGSPQRAENLLKEAVEKFPPHVDPSTRKPGGVPIETFNKVLVAWAKSRDSNGPQRTEQLIVYMDELDGKLDSGGVIKPNLSSFTTLIDAYAQTRDWDGVSTSEQIFNRVLDHYLEGIVEEEPNIACWTIVIGAWSRLAKKNCRGAEERAAKLLKRMESLYEDGRISFGPDAIAMASCLNAWAFSKNKIGPTHAEMILDEMHERYMDGDDSMKPTIRSIQVVIDSWIKQGEDDDAMEQAELVLDRYEEHMYSLGPPDGPPEVHNDIADVYRSMLVGWTKCDPERAQDFLLDMLDRDMQLDNFCFDKVMEADTRLIPEDPKAIQRVHKVFETLEKCRKSNKVKPNERVYTSFIRAMTKAKEQNLAKKARAILQRMITLYEDGNRDIKPTVFTYNAVLNACSETTCTNDPNPTDAFKIALQLFNDMRKQRDIGLDHVSFGNMLKCSNLLPDGPQKNKFITTTFQLCCDKGLLNTFVIRDLQNSATEEMWRDLLDCPQGEVDFDCLPQDWSATIADKRNKPQQRGGFRGGAGRGRYFRD